MIRSTVVLSSTFALATFGIPGIAMANADTPGAISTIASPDNDGANLRSCPSLPNAGVTTGECGAFDRLPNGTHVRMLCWTDGNAPETGASPRWFWVSEVDGPHPGWKGFVWSELVDDQSETPSCDGFDDSFYDYTPPGPEILLEPGPVAPEGFFTFHLTTDESGSAFADAQCFSGDGPDHWVSADGAQSSPISW